MPEHNGITLGAGSPLLTAAGAKRNLNMSEAGEQASFFELCVGKARKGGERRVGDGMTERYPELSLMYAINPNKGGQNSKAARGMAKAMGLLPNVMDVCLPAPRGPFCGLYLEFKRVGEYGDEGQRAMAELFRYQGYAVFEVQGCEEAMQVVMGYLALPLMADWWHGFHRMATLRKTVSEWRDDYHRQLQPKRGRE